MTAKFAGPRVTLDRDLRDLRAWRLVPQADGMALVPPGGLTDGVVRIRDLQRPLRTAADIFARANRPELASISGRESLTTSEGEYAAFCVQRGTIDGQRVVRFVGAVFGDDAYTLVVALASDSEHAAQIEHVARTCVVQCALGLGHRRQRRYRHTPPAGWTEIAWGLATRWRAPDGGELVVHPAMPSTTPVDLVVDAIRARHGFERMDEVTAPRGPCLVRAWRADRVEFVLLDDGRFRYPLELVGNAHRDILARVVDSIILVPPAESMPITDALLHWVD